jgi:hypothetical protein
MPDLSSDQLTALRAAIDRLIPADDFPSASQAHVDRFVVALPEGELGGDETRLLREGLDTLFGTGFHALASEAQDAHLATLERSPFFELLLRLANEGYYADPANGGNAGAASWRMVGWEPGVPATWEGR